MDVIDRLPQLGVRAAYFKRALRDRLSTSSTSANTAATSRKSRAGAGAKGNGLAPEPLRKETTCNRRER